MKYCWTPTNNWIGCTFFGQFTNMTDQHGRLSKGSLDTLPAGRRRQIFTRFDLSHSPSKLLTGLVRNFAIRTGSDKRQGTPYTSPSLVYPRCYTCLHTLMIDKSSKLSHTPPWVIRKILKYLTSLTGLAAVWPGMVSCVVVWGGGEVVVCVGSRWSSSTGQVCQHHGRERGHRTSTTTTTTTTRHCR